MRNNVIRQQTDQEAFLPSVPGCVPPRPTIVPLWTADWKFLARWGHPQAIFRHGDGWLLSSVRTPDLTSFLLLLDDGFAVRETLLETPHYQRVRLNRERNALLILVSDMRRLNAGEPRETLESRLLRMDLATGTLQTVAEGREGAFFALDAVPTDKGLVISDPARRELVLLSETGEQLARHDVGRRLINRVCPAHGGLYLIAHSTLNCVCRTVDPYDSIYRMEWDGRLERLHSSGLPGHPGHVYDLVTMGDRLLYASFHSLTAMNREGAVQWRMPMSAAPWPGQLQEYCVGLFPSAREDTVRAVTWGGRSDMIWELHFNKP